MSLRWALTPFRSDMKVVILLSWDQSAAHHTAAAAFRQPGVPPALTGRREAISKIRLNAIFPTAGSEALLATSCLILISDRKHDLASILQFCDGGPALRASGRIRRCAPLAD